MRTLLLAAIVFCILVPLTAGAQGVSFKTERGNIYSAGGSIEVADDASNDIVAAGGSVVLAGSAKNELLAAGGSIVMSGKTGGDARIAGGNVTISGKIGGEAVIAGGKVTLLPKAEIGSDLIAASGDISIDGAVRGGARVIGGTVIINGTINKNVDIKARRVVIGKNAVLKGNLRYEAPEEARIEQGAVITGEKVFTRRGFEEHRAPLVRFALVWWLVKLLAMITAALAIYFGLREKTVEVTALALNRFGHELFVGFIALIVIPAATLLFFITVVGSLLGFLILFFYITCIILSTVLGALIFTRWVSGRIFKQEPSFAWPVILLGVVMYQVIGLAPVLGWLFKFLFFLSGLGALSHMLYIRLTHKTSPVVP